MNKTLFMETTSIDPQKTAGEIMSLLVQSGARQLLTEYGNDGKLVGLKFLLEINKVPVPFTLPVRIEPIFKIINSRRKYSYDRTEKAAIDRLQAERIAWRQLYRWVQAQLAMIQTGMVEPGEVFMPYIEVEPGVTAWQRAVSGGQLALPPAPEESNIRQFERK